MSLVDRLERLGLAERQAVPGDRRANQLALTRQGRQTLDDLTRRIIEHDERISSRLTEDERNELFRLLAKL
jgi:DNA-binding MarR family transcriptional regulator